MLLLILEQKYTGPPFFGNESSRAGYIPIFPQCNNWSTPSSSNSNLTSRSWTMLPIRLCYAWTIWKVQGQTFKGKVVASLGNREKEHGLTYTVFPRVRKACNLGIIGGFPQG
jgi:hypothetical protein